MDITLSYVFFTPSNDVIAGIAIDEQSFLINRYYCSCLITPPARRAWRSYKIRPVSGFFPVSKVGAPLMGDTAVHSLSHDF